MLMSVIIVAGSAQQGLLIRGGAAFGNYYLGPI